MFGLPFLPSIAISARLKHNEAGEALDLVSVGSVSVFGAVHFEELDVVAVLSLELVNDFVPGGHELNAVVACGHEKVDNHKFIFTCCLYDVLKLVRVLSLSAMGLFPPVHVHCCSS